MAVKVQLTGGAFQDPSGSALADGYLLMQLSQDAAVNGSDQIAAGIELKINLDQNGNIVTSPAQSVWPNDVLTPLNTFYTVSAYTAEGQLVWGPNSQQVFSTPSPFSVSQWVPTVVSVSTTPVVTYDVGYYHPYATDAGETTLLLPIERPVRFAANLAPSLATCGTNATALAIYSVRKNGIEFATISFSPGSSSGSIVSAVGTTFSAGDLLSIVSPSPSDSTLANVGIILSGVALN